MQRIGAHPTHYEVSPYLRGSRFLRISVGTPTSLTGFIPAFLQSLQANAGTVPRSGHNCFLHISLPLILHVSACNSTLYALATDSVVKQPTQNTRRHDPKKHNTEKAFEILTLPSLYEVHAVALILPAALRPWARLSL
jgi:hypothetical protein